MKILCAFGTRPEAIKMAPVIQELRKYPEIVEVKVCITAQHRQMLDQVLELFHIPPDHDLDIMEENQLLSELTSSVITGFQRILSEEKPDWVIVQGDTTSTMATALASFYNRVKIGHVEAGLRTWNKYHPFPEEMNRRITAHLSDLHFAPTTMAQENLMKEGIDESRIVVTGNTVIDAMYQVAALPNRLDVLERIGVSGNNFRLLLVTAHRRENFGAPIENICRALLEIAARYRNSVRIIYPVHLNPNIRKPVYRMLGAVSNITLVEPLDYLSFVHLMKHSYLVLTDSGGIQEEAPSLGKPVLVLREITERPEAVEAGTVRAVGTSEETIVRETCRLLNDHCEYERMARANNPYGDGHAAERIVGALLGSQVVCL